MGNRRRTFRIFLAVLGAILVIVPIVWTGCLRIVEGRSWAEWDWRLHRSQLSVPVI